MKLPHRDYNSNRNMAGLKNPITMNKIYLPEIQFHIIVRYDRQRHM
jgi:hypothetical protein